MTKMLVDKLTLEQALEALECVDLQSIVPDYGSGHYSVSRLDGPHLKSAITVLRAALAEQEQAEPVATVVARQYDDGTYAGNELKWAGRNCENDFPVGTKLYTAPTQGEQR